MCFFHIFRKNVFWVLSSQSLRLWNIINEERTFENYGCSTQSALHMVHMLNVPNFAGSQIGQEGEVVLVHSFHSIVVVWHHFTNLPGLLHDIPLPQQQGQIPKNYHKKNLEHLHRFPVDSSSDFSGIEARWQWHWHSTILCDDTMLGDTVILIYCCVSVVVWKVTLLHL